MNVYEITYSINGKTHVGTVTDDTLALAWGQLKKRVAIKGMTKTSHRIVG